MTMMELNSRPSFSIVGAALRPGRSHDSAAGMRSRSAHVEALHRRSVLRPTGRRAEEEQLLERQLTLEDVALGKAEGPFDVERRQDLAMEDDVLDVRRVLRDGVDHGVAERLAMVVPACPLPSSCTARTGRSTTSRACPEARPKGPSGSGMTMSMYGRRE